MVHKGDTGVDLVAVLSSLAGRQVRIGEIISALDLGRSTYYEQRDEGRLLSADNLLLLAAEFDLNPVELMAQCGLLPNHAVLEYAEKLSGIPPTKQPRSRFKRRADAPPL